MKLLLKIVGGLAVLVLLLVLVAFVLPRHYKVERAMVMKAKPEAVLAQVADLKVWKNWGVWQERDPQMKLSYSAPSSGVGSWASRASSGTSRSYMVAKMETVPSPLSTTSSRRPCMG